jgi:hypothetical protein
VKLINLEDLVILGPGSEWLWTMVSGIVLAVTFLAIYRQLSLQRDAAAIEQVRVIYREWADERMSRAKLETLSLIRDGAEPATVLIAGVDIGDFWEGYAYLVKAGNIDRRLMYDSLGPAARIWWGLLASSAHAARQQANDQGVWIDFEWLAGTFAEFDRVAGEPAAYDAAFIAQRLPDLIETNRTAVARFEELRAVIVRPAPIETSATPAARRRQRTQPPPSAPPAGAVSAV